MTEQNPNFKFRMDFEDENIDLRVLDELIEAAKDNLKSAEMAVRSFRESQMGRLENFNPSDKTDSVMELNTADAAYLKSLELQAKDYFEEISRLEKRREVLVKDKAHHNRPQ